MTNFLFDWIVTGILGGMILAASFTREWMRLAFLFFSVLLLLACYYVRVGAAWVGLTHLVIYVGGVLILQLFGMMFTQRSMGSQSIRLSKPLIGILGLVVLIYASWSSLRNGTWHQKDPVVDSLVNLQVPGQILLGSWLIVFELLSVYLLLALVAAAYLVRKQTMPT